MEKDDHYGRIIMGYVDEKWSRLHMLESLFYAFR